ncbi:hypothetical protein [Ruegeria sp. AU67]|nr:hypothetical protein [Ruegeria sp. AU67]
MLTFATAMANVCKGLSAAFKYPEHHYLDSAFIALTVNNVRGR